MARRPGSQNRSRGGGTGHHSLRGPAFPGRPVAALAAGPGSQLPGPGPEFHVARPVDWQPPGSRAVWVGPSLKLLPDAAALVSVGQSCQCGLLAAWNYERSTSLAATRLRGCQWHWQVKERANPRVVLPREPFSSGQMPSQQYMNHEALSESRLTRTLAQISLTAACRTCRRCARRGQNQPQLDAV
jgi:hypothetical protein